MKRSILAMTVASIAIAAAPADAQGYGRAGRGHWGEQQALRIQFGAFEPDGESQYWDDKALDFTGGASDLEDLDVGISYVRFLGERLGLVASSNFYSGEISQHYLDFVDERGGEIFHDTGLELANFNVGLLFHLMRRDAVLVPYVGAGAGVYVWTLYERGDFIDFDSGDEIFFGDFEDEGAAFGYYLQAGLEVPFATNWSLYGDIRWESADDELGGELAGLGKLDISGTSYSLGVGFSF